MSERLVLLGGDVRRRGLFGARSPLELGVLAAGVGSALLISIISPGPIGWLIAALAAAGGWLATRPAGPTGALLLTEAPHRGRLRHQIRTGANAFIPDPVDPTGDVLAGPTHQPQAVGAVTWLSYTPAGAGPLAVLWHRNPGEAHYVSAVMEITGVGAGILEAQAYARISEAFGRMAAYLAKPTVTVDSLQLLTRTLPADTYAHEQYVAATADAQAPEVLHASYRQLCAHSREVSEQHRHFLAVRMPMTAQFLAEAGRHAPGPEGYAAAAAAGMFAVAAQVRRAGFEVVTGLGPRRLAALIRSLYDPDFGLGAVSGAGPGLAWPAHTWDTHAVQVGAKWWHRLAWVPPEALPLEPVHTRWLQPFVTSIHPATIRTTSVVMDLIPTSRARTQVVADLTYDRGQAGHAAQAGQVTDGVDEAQVGHTEQRRADLLYGQAAGAQVAMFVQVSAASATALAAGCTRVESAAQDCGIAELRWLDGRHHHAMITVLPLVRGVQR